MIEPLTAFLDRVLQVLAGLDPGILALATWLFTALETTALVGLLVPGDVVVLLAGSTADSVSRFALVMGAAAAGTFTGELCGYTLGRAVGPRLRASWFGRALGEHRWTRAEAYLCGKGARMLVPIRFVSVLHAVAPVVAGTVKMPLRRFAFWSGAGAVVWAAVYTSIGVAAGSAYREYGHLGLLTSVVLLTVAAAVVAIRSRRRANRAARTAGDQRAAEDEVSRPNDSRHVSKSN
jgi:membrane-associated protein